MITSSGIRYYYHYDGLDSVIALSYRGNIVKTYSYDVFGGPTIRDPNNEPRAASDVNNPYMFNSRKSKLRTQNPVIFTI